MTIFMMIFALAITAPDDVMAVCVPAIENMEEATGYEFEAIVTIFVDADHAYTTWEAAVFGKAIVRIEIHLPLNWKPWMVWHELGHVVMAQVYNYRNDYLPFMGDTCSFDRDMWAETCEEEALVEGFAIYMQAVFSNKVSELLENIREYRSVIPVEVAAYLYKMSPRLVFYLMDEYHPKSLDIFSRYRSRRSVQMGRIRMAPRRQ